MRLAMPSRRYLRAYMAGLVAPSVVVLLVSLAVAAGFSRIRPDVVQVMLFPAAINPAAWGAWNALYVALPAHRRLPIGWHGAVLPLLLVPLGVALAHLLHISFVTSWRAAAVTPPVVVAYYVLWKYVVRFLNGVLEIEPRQRMTLGAAS
jgi:hypothetical protein